ncbi:mechanosensitive ion channel family protein [Leekyejoonella antrihumi]|uniref:Mechanosensitive ion channel family protein n=1 Tax=Leekyejoonella antrihumi TaxID=1660198 RepID=A0A563E554_9MICO|nr:mechanosensitive ion channel family protein [Leekyejoonella antrihumi]TWP37670.1 mechanosensitive ion channel family protein [Leekyejoonella antrihumi]
MPHLHLVDNSPDSVTGWLIGTPLMVIAIIVCAVVLRWLIHRAISRVVKSMISHGPRRPPSESPRAARVLRQAAGLDNERRAQRAETTGSVLRSVTSLVVFGIAALTIMAEVGVPLGPLLASAGVGGVALGFGAQSLVKDFLSGIFMIVEDQYGVGDVIDTGDLMGTVEEVTLRITRIRDFEGAVWYLRNGEILRIGNRSQGWSTALIDIPIGYDQPVDIATRALEQIAQDLDDAPEWHQLLLETPTVNGVQSVAAGEINLRMTAKCVPMQQYGVTRELRRRAKEAFDAAGVKGPELPPYAKGPAT